MTIRRTTIALSMALGAVGAGVTGARATEAASPPSAAPANAGPDVCMGAVNALGAPMGEAQTVEWEGKSALRFVVRTNGIDYDVLCDPATGVVKDVNLRPVGADVGTN